MSFTLMWGTFKDKCGWPLPVYTKVNTETLVWKICIENDNRWKWYPCVGQRRAGFMFPKSAKISQNLPIPDSRASPRINEGSATNFLRPWALIIFKKFRQYTSGLFCFGRWLKSIRVIHLKKQMNHKSPKLHIGICFWPTWYTLEHQMGI